jgi:hypothetical protein
MKIKDLIEELSTLDPELPVLRPGYEGGFAEVLRVLHTRLVSNYHKEWYYGPHEFPENGQIADMEGVILQ